MNSGIRSSLRQRTLIAGGWSFVGQLLSLAIRFCGSLILTRIFDPATFGIVAIAVTVHLFVYLISDFGIRPAVIQSRNADDPVFLNTAWTLQIVRGVAIWGIALFVAVALWLAQWHGLAPSGSVYSNPQLPFIIGAIAFTSVIQGFQSIKTVSAERHLRRATLTSLEVSAQILSLTLTIVIGAIAKSVWAFVIGALAHQILFTLSTHIFLKGPRDRIAWDKRSLGELSRYGRWIFYSSVISSLTQNGDRLALGYWLDPKDVGTYSIAANLIAVPDTITTRVLSAVAMPAFSSIVKERPEQIREKYARVRYATDSLCMLASGFVFATGILIVSLMYDTRYAQAGNYLQWLSLLLIFSRYAVAQNLFLAIGKPGYLAILNLVRVASLFSAVTVGYLVFGAQGAVIGIALHGAPVAIATSYFSAKAGVFNFRQELFFICLWPVGYLAGAGCLLAATYIRAYVSMT